MLQAKIKNGNSVALYQYSREEIAWLRANEEFYCPICKGKLMIRAGVKTIAHFAHKRAVDCISHEGGEGEYHEKGKLQIFRWLASQGIKAEMEVYFPVIKQRTDILVTIGNKRIAMEYQCVRIPVQDILKRTNGYLQEGIQPIWIIGGNHFNRLGRHQVKINQFLLQFFHRFNQESLPIMYFFDPQTTFFIKAANIFPVNQYKIYSNLKVKKLTEMNFLDLFTQNFMPQGELMEVFRKAKYKFRMHHPQRTYGNERKWYSWLYSMGTHREFLPSIIFLPVASQYQMNTAPWDWQSRICLEIIVPLEIGETFSWEECLSLLKYCINPNNPLMNGLSDPLLEYLHLLASLKIISITSNETFQKRQDIHFYSNVEDALVGDQKILEEISEILSQNTSMIR
ncbi:competence protein CoiA [Ornithinibacillus scapharcae]|uniref:competence protein CoiA n=1 Tax=Ornithinibacillus scapharcae TaxID=1147159 RepID=UPI000225B29F|nr:competence protein CoiA family protein [Ornithinibacillus scapharcae]